MQYPQLDRPRNRTGMSRRPAMFVVTEETFHEETFVAMPFAPAKLAFAKEEARPQLRKTTSMEPAAGPVL